MRRDQQIQVNALLLEREELFVRIHALEAAAGALLGEPYPFARPPLPSDPRAKAKPGRARAAADPVRRLEGFEVSYRVTYRRAGVIAREEHEDPAALRTLLHSQGLSLQVLRLETIDIAGRPMAVLLEAPPAP